MENKAIILEKLLDLLQNTRNLRDLVSLDYEKTGDGFFNEFAVATFERGDVVRINISWDSGTAIIKDVLRGLGYLGD